jgi:Protein of unknown function (DUF3078)
MKKLLLIFLIAISFNSFAQEIPDSVLVDGWNTLGVVGLNLSQTALVNWSQGGSNSLAYAGYANLAAVLKDHPWKWKNRLSIIYGRTKLEDVGYRTTENDIYFETVLSRNVGWVVDPFVSVTVRTAVTKGYDYSVADTNIQIVDFFDPGYVSEAIGFTYDQNKIITTRLGLGFQQTFTNRFTNYTDDPETPEIEKFKFDTGIESVTEVKYEFLENMTYYSFLRLFSRFTSLDVWDVRWDNIITAKVNDYINVNFSVTVLHEISQTRKTQLRESLQLGLTYTLF